MGEPVKIKHFPQSQQTFKIPLVANDNAFIGDIASTDQEDSDKPISCGLFRMEKGKPLEYEYNYHEVKIVLEGEFIITDGSGQKVRAVPGDVLHIPKGAKMTFESPNYGLAFYTGQRAKDTA